MRSIQGGAVWGDHQLRGRGREFPTLTPSASVPPHEGEGGWLACRISAPSLPPAVRNRGVGGGRARRRRRVRRRPGRGRGRRRVWPPFRRPDDRGSRAFRRRRRDIPGRRPAGGRRGRGIRRTMASSTSVLCAAARSLRRSAPSVTSRWRRDFASSANLASRASVRRRVWAILARADAASSLRPGEGSPFFSRSTRSSTRSPSNLAAFMLSSAISASILRRRSPRSSAIAISATAAVSASVSAGGIGSWRTRWNIRGLSQEYCDMSSFISRRLAEATVAIPRAREENEESKKTQKRKVRPQRTQRDLRCLEKR